MPNGVFTHRQLYVAMSGARNENRLRIHATLIKNGKQKMENIVYKKL